MGKSLVSFFTQCISRYTGFAHNDVYNVIITHAYTAATHDATITVPSCYVIAAGAPLSC